MGDEEREILYLSSKEKDGAALDYARNLKNEIAKEKISITYKTLEILKR